MEVKIDDMYWSLKLSYSETTDSVHPPTGKIVRGHKRGKCTAILSRRDDLSDTVTVGVGACENGWLRYRRELMRQVAVREALQSVEDSRVRAELWQAYQSRVFFLPEKEGTPC